MKFKSGTRRRAVEYEKDLARQWKENKTFEKSVEMRPADNSYVFYDGPPFITGVPHHGTLLSSIVKDAVPRYQTMKGKRVERVWGWDCHGLPAETYTEKKLGIKGKQEVLDYGLENYIIACRENMVTTGNLWEDTVDRIGRWVDFQGAYKTMDNSYMESVWWAFKTLYDKGKIYEGEKVLMYCTQDATPLSKAEVTMDAGAYQDVTDPSVYVKFGLLDKDDVTKKPEKWLLGWTTTPWTLPGNTALAVNEKLEYADVKLGDEVFIVAKELVEKVFIDEKHQSLEYEILRTFPGTELVGREYLELDITGQATCIDYYNGNEYHIWAADYVTTESGTGIVHLAPAYGEEDFELAKRNNIPIVHVIDDNGLYTFGDFLGKNVWETNKSLAKMLHEKGDVWKIEYIQHSYPHCHRCGTRLMYRAHPSWFMDIEGQREQMLVENTEHINWFPEHVKHGRFEHTVQTAPDWNLSRDRFWATPMPVWKGKDAEGKEHIKVLGSYDELEQLSGKRLEDYHRPWIDDVTFESDGVKYTRIDKVMDCWFESGSMPFAQFHYPFENVEKFESNFPGDFIVEYIGQVRAWFYYVHAVNVGLFGRNAFKNVIVTGNLAGNDGRKMSKSYGNYTDPNELMDEYSADSLRFLLLSSPLLNGEDFSLQDKEVGDVARKLSMIWNMYDFFTMYAEVDGWEWTPHTTPVDLPAGKASSPADLSATSGLNSPVLTSPYVNTARSAPPARTEIGSSVEHGAPRDPSDELTNPLDQWIVSRLHQLVSEVETHMDRYDIPSAVKPILPFIDDASNWYVRRSRRRFWKSDSDADKDMAYRTLHYVLVRLSYVLAPFTPFLADELYQKLTGDESVHLQDWLPAGHVNEIVLDEMAMVRSLINDGLSQRAEAKLKVRQPLRLFEVRGKEAGRIEKYSDIFQDELNVKMVLFNDRTRHPDDPEDALVGELSTELTPELKREGLVREVIRHVQSARKAAGLNVDDRISLILKTEDQELQKAIDEHAKTIQTETLANELTDSGEKSHHTTVKVEGSELTIALEKA